MEETRHRPAARVICLDAARRVLLLCWRDRSTDTRLWEPPGGGIEPGETPLEAARRELTEETGLDPAAVLHHSVSVERDVIWSGMRYVGPEQFFVAYFPGERPSVTRSGLRPDEWNNLRGHAWFALSELHVLEGRLEPPALLAVLAALDGARP